MPLVVLSKSEMKNGFGKKILGIFTGIFALIGLIFIAVFIGMQFGVFNVRGSTLSRNESFDTKKIHQGLSACHYRETCSWKETSEWLVVKDGLKKDAEIIYDVSEKTGVHPRIIASLVVPEQLRYFTADREKFKQFFEPLKILGSLSKFSLGVSGIKQETANQIEEYAKNPDSPFYPGAFAESLIEYKDSNNSGEELYKRLTDPTDHYYSYLYTALFIKEISNQWNKSGYDISKNAGIMATLWNIGFENSKPKSNPQIGGAEIVLSNNETYRYGDLAHIFYDSPELIDVF